MSDLTLAQLLAVMPNLKKDKAELYLPHLNKALAEFKIDTGLRIAAFLGQIAHESAELRYMEEIASGSAYDNRKDLGNTLPEAVAIAKKNNTTVGKWFKGHGPIQITGYYNHKKYGELLKIDALNSPKLLSEPKNAMRSACCFWSESKLNDLADKKDYTAITKKINGGTNGLDDRLKYTQRALKVLKVDAV